MATAIVTPDDAVKLIPPVVEQARNLTVRDADDYELACTFLQFVASRKKQVEDVFDPIVSKAHAAHKEAVAQKKKFMDPLLQAESAVKLKVSAWRIEEDRKRREEEDRQAAELKRLQEEAAIQEAAQLQAQGQSELADIVLQEAAEAPAPVVVLESAVPKQDGISARKTWKFRITNEALIPREYLMVNESAIGAIVRAQKSMCKIPGIQVYSEDSVSVRSR